MKYILAIPLILIANLVQSAPVCSFDRTNITASEYGAGIEARCTETITGFYWGTYCGNVTQHYSRWIDQEVVQGKVLYYHLPRGIFKSPKTCDIRLGVRDGAGEMVIMPPDQWAVVNIVN